MSRLIAITDHEGRSARVAFWTPRVRPPHTFLAPCGSPARSARLISAVLETSHRALRRRFGSDNALALALRDGDPELEHPQIGNKLEGGARVYVTEDDQVVHGNPAGEAVTYSAAGVELDRRPFVDSPANVGRDAPALPWTGRFMPLDDVVRRVAIVRQLQLRPVDPLTHDFLHGVATVLHEAARMLVVGAGPKGLDPLVFVVNGSPFRGFLEGTVDGAAFRLVLHLSNLEIKPVPKETSDA